MDDSERFELDAAEFHAATGKLAPGKDQPAAMGGSPSYEERAAAWNAYWAGKDAMAKENERLQAIKDLVAKQAEDEGLWFVAVTAPEGYLQQELRKLHALIEGSEDAPK